MKLLKHVIGAWLWKDYTAECRLFSVLKAWSGGGAMRKRAQSPPILLERRVSGYWRGKMRNGVDLVRRAEVGILRESEATVRSGTQPRWHVVIRVRLGFGQRIRRCWISLPLLTFFSLIYRSPLPACDKSCSVASWTRNRASFRSNPRLALGR